MPDDMKDKLSKLSKINQRSLGAEIRVMLELALNGKHAEIDEAISKLNSK